MIKALVVGYGNVGKSIISALQLAEDMEPVALLRRNKIRPQELPPQIPVITDPGEVPEIHVALLAVPSRRVISYMEEFLPKGINTVDSFDIHGTELLSLLKKAHALAKGGGATAMIAAGWDPGTDSVIRLLMEAIAPSGLTQVNFGPGISMGHSVACRAIEGVKAAFSYTIPLGDSHHRRRVVVELEGERDLESISKDIKGDPYFVNDETTVEMVDHIHRYEDFGHGVLLERFGKSSSSHNTTMEFKMRGTNPSMTAQIMVAAARASLSMAPGSYTLLEIPPIYLLPYGREELIKRLV